MKERTPAPPLRFPKTTVGESAEKEIPLKKFKETPLNIRFVHGIDVGALVINLLCVIFLFIVIRFILGSAQGIRIHPALLLAIPSICVTAIIVFFQHRMWMVADAQTAVKYLDPLISVIDVYFQGFHFVPWYSKSENDVTNFQKHTEINARQADNTAITFQTLDGYDVAVNLVCFFNRREEESALKKSLKYTMEGLNTRTRAMIASRLSTFGGLNTYQTLLENKDGVAEWISAMFGGENSTSPYEEEAGLRIFDPLMVSFDLTADSKRIYADKAKAAAFTSSFRELAGEDAKLNPKDAADAVQVATGTATRNINSHTHEYVGITPGITVFAPGGGDIAVGTRGGK
ncbi:MAG: hypothetical protein RLY66_388 [Candidatus Parcubacteria bacterium]|jgi:hypothetical protein